MKSMILSGMLLASTVVSGAVVISQDFESDEVGSGTKWARMYYNAESYAGVSDEAHSPLPENNKHGFKVYKATNTKSGWMHLSFPKQTGALKISFDFMAENNLRFVFDVFSEWKTHISLELNRNVLSNMASRSDRHKLADIIPGSWYRVIIEINKPLKKAEDFTIEVKSLDPKNEFHSKVENMIFYNIKGSREDFINRLKITTWPGKTLFLDNLTVDSIEEQK